MLIVISTGFIVASIFFLLLSLRLRRNSGIPSGEIIYLDSHKLHPQDKPLLDESIWLTGKPDFVIRINRINIPVEVKSNTIYNGPFESHLMQLAAYCRLIDAASGNRPPYGVLKYKNTTKRIDYTEDLEKTLLQQIDKMRFILKKENELHRSHNSVAKCNRCAYSNICDEKLM